MANVYSNLPSKELNSLQKVVQYFDGYYTAPIDLDVQNIDMLSGFFESKGFDKSSAQNITYVVLKTAKQSNYKAQEIIDALNSYNSLQLNEFLLSILNYNRVKTSSLGLIKKINSLEAIERNIRA
jgi:hypothetical protein